MTDNNHSITPPPELVQQWWEEADQYEGDLKTYFDHIATEAARWGADQELNECCKWLPKLPPWSADDLRRHRRPKPPSLKEQALALVKNAGICDHISPEHEAILIRALEALDD